MNLYQVMEVVQEDDIGKLDITTNKFGFEHDGTFTVNNDEFVLNDHAASQLFSKYNMPSRYFTKLLTLDPELTAYHFNKIHKSQTPEEMLFRTKHNPNTHNNTVRAVLSDVYSILDNNMVVQGLIDVIGDFTQDYEVIELFLNDERMHIRVVFPSTSRDLSGPRSVGDILQVGIDDINSEVGLSSQNVSGLVWRLVCTNGLRRASLTESYIQRHIYLSTDDFRRNMSVAMSVGIQSSIGLMQNFAAAKDIYLSNPIEVMQVLSDRFDISKSIVEKAQELWEHDSTVYGVVNGFTAAARGLGNESRLDLEKLSGKILATPERDWIKIDKAAQQYLD